MKPRAKRNTLGSSRITPSLLDIEKLKKEEIKKKTDVPVSKKIQTQLDFIDFDLNADGLKKLIPFIEVGRVGGLDFSMNSPAIATVRNGVPRTLTACVGYNEMKEERVIQNDTPVFKRHYERIAYIVEVLDTFLTKYPCDILFVEGYAYHAVGRLLDLAEFTGSVLFYLAKKHNFLVYKVPPTIVKKTLTNNAFAQKPIVWYACNKIVPHCYKNYDESDAMAILLAGLAAHTNEIENKSKKSKIIRWA